MFSIYTICIFTISRVYKKINFSNKRSFCKQTIEFFYFLQKNNLCSFAEWYAIVLSKPTPKLLFNYVQFTLFFGCHRIIIFVSESTIALTSFLTPYLLAALGTEGYVHFQFPVYFLSSFRYCFAHICTVHEWIFCLPADGLLAVPIATSMLSLNVFNTNVRS